MAGEGKEAKLSEIMKNIYVSDIIAKQKLVSVTEAESVSEAARLLSTNNISSVPVFKTKGNFSLDNCAGIVDFCDIVSVVIELRKKGFSEEDPRKHIWTKLTTMSVKEAVKINLAKFVQLNVGDPIMEAVEKCAEFAIRRMLAVDKKGDVVGVVSPSEMIKQITDAVGGPAVKESTLDKTIKELVVGQGPVLTVQKKDKLSAAFQVMIKEMVSAIGIVDGTSKKLVGSVSASDVSILFDETKSAFLRTSTWNFFTHKKEKEVDDSFPFFSVTEESSLRRTIEKLLQTNVHHLYIVDGEDVPIKVVGFSEVCRALLKSA